MIQVPEHLVCLGVQFGLRMILNKLCLKTTSVESPLTLFIAIKEHTALWASGQPSAKFKPLTDGETCQNFTLHELIYNIFLGISKYIL